MLRLRYHRHSWPVGADLSLIAACDGRQFHSRRAGNQRCMKGFACVPVANKTDADVFTLRLPLAVRLFITGLVLNAHINNVPCELK